MTTPDTLQEKLRDIHVTTSYEGYNPNTRTHETTAREVYLTDDAIAQILQALTDAGYKSPSEVDGIIYEYKHYQALALIGKMTGQEFYDRFKAELNSGGLAHVLKGYESDDIDSVFGVVETVAKRAAGVSDE
jgi:hypothetical protein